MTVSHPGGKDVANLTSADLDEMSTDELARLATELDDVEVVHNQRRFPIPGTRAEKRAERAVATWFVLSALSGLAFLLAFLFWPYEYVAPFDEGYGTFILYTPIIGVTFDPEAHRRRQFLQDGDVGFQSGPVGVIERGAVVVEVDDGKGRNFSPVLGDLNIAFAQRAFGRFIGRGGFFGRTLFNGHFFLGWTAGQKDHGHEGQQGNR